MNSEQTIGYLCVQLWVLNFIVNYSRFLRIRKPHVNFVSQGASCNVSYITDTL